MSPKYQSIRSTRRLARKSKRNFFITLILVIILLYIALLWILPVFINGLSLVRDFTNPPKKVVESGSQNSSLAPPVLNIPYEATNTAEVDIKGYGAPNSKVALYLDDEKRDVADVSSDGTFEFKSVSLALGTNNIYGKSIDEEEKESLPSKTFKLLYDNEKPSLSIKEPEDNKQITGGDKRIKVAGQTEPNAQVFINDTQAIVDKDGNFSTELSLNDGENNFTIKSLDKAQNFTEVSKKITYTP